MILFDIGHKSAFLISLQPRKLYFLTLDNAMLQSLDAEADTSTFLLTYRRSHWTPSPLQKGALCSGSHLGSIFLESSTVKILPFPPNQRHRYTKYRKEESHADTKGSCEAREELLLSTCPYIFQRAPRMKRWDRDMSKVARHDIELHP